MSNITTFELMDCNLEFSPSTTFSEHGCDLKNVDSTTGWPIQKLKQISNPVCKMCKINQYMLIGEKISSNAGRNVFNQLVLNDDGGYELFQIGRIGD